MNVVCLGSKGSAVTTTALALAGGWPVTSVPVVMVEADPAGGDIAARFDLAASPSLLTAAASLQQPTVGLLLEHTQTLPGGLRVLPAPLRSLEVGGGMNDFTRAVVAPLRGSHDVNLVIDAGRCDVRTIPALTLHADLVVIVIRQELRSAQATVGRCLHAQQVVETLATHGMSVVAVVVGDAPYKAMRSVGSSVCPSLVCWRKTRTVPVTSPVGRPPAALLAARIWPSPQPASPTSSQPDSLAHWCRHEHNG